MRRGEIYLIRHRGSIGHEIAKARPGVIVSNNILTNTSDVVEVVYLTTKPKKDMPTHALINATGMPSTALCEQIDSVATELVGSYCGTCSKEEMEDIDRALLASLGITDPREKATTAEDQKKAVANDPVNHPSHYTDGKIETIEFIEDKGLNYHLGNAVKYISRAGKKDPSKTEEDLNKAVWYLTREIARLEGAASR